MTLPLVIGVANIGRFSQQFTEGETFQLDGYGFGDATSNVRFAFDGANAPPVGSAVQTVNGAFRIEYTVPNVGQVGAGENKQVLGRITSGGQSWNIGDTTFFPNVHPTLNATGGLMVAQPPDPP